MAKKTIPFSGKYESAVPTKAKRKTGRKLGSGAKATRTKANPFAKAAAKHKPSY